MVWSINMLDLFLGKGSWLIPTVPRELFGDVRSHNFFLSLWIRKIPSEEDRRLRVIAPRRAFLPPSRIWSHTKTETCILVVTVALFQKEFLRTVVPSLWNGKNAPRHQALSVWHLCFRVVLLLRQLRLAWLVPGEDLGGGECGWEHVGKKWEELRSCFVIERFGCQRKWYSYSSGRTKRKACWNWIEGKVHTGPVPGAAEKEALVLFIRACPSHLPVSAVQLDSRRHCCTVFGPQQERPRDKNQRSAACKDGGMIPFLLHGFNVMLMLSDVITENRCHLESRWLTRKSLTAATRACQLAFMAVSSRPGQESLGGSKAGARTMLTEQRGLLRPWSSTVFSGLIFPKYKR